MGGRLLPVLFSTSPTQASTYLSTSSTSHRFFLPRWTRELSRSFKLKRPPWEPKRSRLRFSVEATSSVECTEHAKIPSLKKHSIKVPFGNRDALCHISELSSDSLGKAEDVVKVGDRIDVKLIEINEKGQLRMSHRALLPQSETENAAAKQKQTPAQTSVPTKENIPPSRKPFIKSSTSPTSPKAPAPQLKESKKLRQKEDDDKEPSEMVVSMD